MTVELRDETAAELDRQRSDGDYATADEVVAAGLAALDEQRARQAVREKIAVGFAEVERGEGLDGEAVFRELFNGLGLPFDGRRP